MKRLVTILSLLIITASLSAQNFQRKGFSLGADRDTLLYIIASPFDNWYITPRVGIQTFIGNELESSARRNKLNYNLSVEIGKWIIPDIAVSGRVAVMSIDGQSKYPRQPFIDFLNDDSNANGYYPFHAHAISFMGYVILDWTNFLCGYEAGRRKHLHVFTPLGLGASMLFDIQRNPTSPNFEVGTFRRNFELSYTGGIGIEWEASQSIALNLTAEIFGSESTWDWSPYDNSHSIFDVMPLLTFGVRFNLLQNVTKYNPYTKQSSREKVNHEFISFGSRNTLSTLKGRIDRLNSQIDSVQNLSDLRGQQDSLAIAAMTEERDSLQRQLDSADYRTYGRAPANMIEELISANEVLGLPATIVYFQLDRYDLDYNGRKRLQNFAKEISNVDDTVEFYIIGAADSLTGTKRHNMWLSERRSEAAYNMLVERFNVDPNQLIKIALGGITEYDPQENNRMAMVIMRTPEVEAIIERWTKDKK